MQGKFIEIHAAAEYIGPGAIEVPLYQSEITDIVRRRGMFGQRIKCVPATGHPSRFFEDTPYEDIPTGTSEKPGIGRVRYNPARRERSVPLKAIVAEINYNLFDMELGKQQSQFAYLQAKDLADTVDGVMRTHDVALWNGCDTSLNAPTTAEYYGAAGQIAAGGNTTTVGTTQSIVDGIKHAVAEMMANGASMGTRPTAIYANPVLLDLIDREMKTELNVVLETVQLESGFSVKVLTTQAGKLPLIPDWTLSYTGTPGSGSAILPAYIVTEELIEYHWLSDPSPRIFQMGVPGSLASKYVVVKFGGLVVKCARTAHRQVLTER
jgi:hypothetical protein